MPNYGLPTPAARLSSPADQSSVGAGDSKEGQKMPTVRRNGKRPSCEPCRISKLACDHATPICGRCQRRKIPQKCTYHPNPMTGKTGVKHRPKQNRDSSISELTQSDARSADYTHSQVDARSADYIRSHVEAHTASHIPGISPVSPLPPPTPNLHKAELPPARSWNFETTPTDSILPARQDSQPANPSPSSNWRSSLVPETSVHSSAITPRSEQANDWTPAPGLKRSSQNPYSGYLGSTSFSAVFDEHHSKIGIDSANDQHGISEPLVERLSSREHDRNIKDGATVLAQLADFKHLENLIVRWLEYARNVALMAPFLPACCESIGLEIASKQLGYQQLLATSEKMLQNSTRPVKVPSTCRISEYHALFTGENMRWEVLAALFTAAGLSAILLAPTDPLLSFVGQHPSDKQALIHRMVELGSTCLSFCTDIGHLNDFGSWVLHEHCLLVSQILGDAHYLTWRRLGDLAASVFAMGLHQEIKDSPDVPFWLTEFRRRCLGIIYGIDKMMSVFLGRPPRVSYRYCHLVPPLDLEFEDLALEGSDLTKKLESLDEVTGWNKEGEIRKSSHTRTFVIINRLREEILELSLGRSTEDVSVTSEDIARRNEQMWNDFPKCLKYYPEIWTGKRTSDECVITVIIYLDVIYNEFLLQRTLVRRIRAPSEALVRISRLLLTTALAVVTNRSQVGTAGCDAAWIVVLYGLPSSGVLALELLQQTQNRVQVTKDFPRSEVIQNLSVFVSCLGWIHHEGDGNYQLCIQARNMIQRILDRVLSPESAYSSQQPLPTPSNSEFPEEAMYDFSWMDNVTQFDADFWSNLDFHPLLAIPDSSM